MLFHANTVALDFSLTQETMGPRGAIQNRLHFVVPLGATFDVPDRIAYCINAHGIAAAEGPGEGDAAPIKGVLVPPLQRPNRAPNVSINDANQELRDVVNGDDNDDDGEPRDHDDVDDDAAARTLEQLDQQGIRVYGKRPKRGAK